MPNCPSEKITVILVHLVVTYIYIPTKCIKMLVYPHCHRHWILSVNQIFGASVIGDAHALYSLASSVSCLFLFSIFLLGSLQRPLCISEKSVLCPMCCNLFLICLPLLTFMVWWEHRVWRQTLALSPIHHLNDHSFIT